MEKIMKKTRRWKSILLLLAVSIICPIIMSSCECDFNLNIGTTPKSIPAPVIYVDMANQKLQWTDLSETDIYEVRVNNVIKKTFTIPASQKNALIELSYTNLVNNNAENSITVIGKNKDSTSTANYDSKPSNEVIINTSNYFTKASNSNYTFEYNKSNNLAPTTTYNSSQQSLVITWNDIQQGSAPYLVRTFSNSNGYAEKLIYPVSFANSKPSIELTNIPAHEIVSYNISLVTSNNTATVVSGRNEYYHPDGHYTTIAFDGKLWDYYINSQDELNAIVYYNYLSRTQEYTLTFDTNFKDTASHMHSAVDEAFDSFYETSYFDFLIENAPNCGKVDGNLYTVQIDYDNVSECNTSKKVDTAYLLNSIDMGTQYYENVDYTKRSETYDDFVSDDYFLTMSVTKSEQLYTAIENKITPIVDAGSRADLIYTKAKEVLREIISDEMSDYEKVLSIFDWITYNTVYDYSGTSYRGGYNFTQDCCYYLEGVFLQRVSMPDNTQKGVAVCDGFSKAFSMLCNMEGIDCIRIVGTANTGSGSGGHAWNKVKVNGEYSIVDITWTELINGSKQYSNNKNTEYLSHRYFLISESAVAKTHFPFEERRKFAMYPTNIDMTINYYEQPNFSYIDQQGIFFDDQSTSSNSEITITQYIDSSEDLQKALYLPLLNNSQFVEFAVDYEYLLELCTKHNASDLIEAFQTELKAMKFSPQLISPIYDATFLPFDNGRSALVCVFDTTLLVNEPATGKNDELYDILQAFGKYANYNSNIVYSSDSSSEQGYVLEIGFDAQYIQTITQTSIIDLKSFQQAFAIYVSLFNNTYQLDCECTFEYTNKSEKSSINGNIIPTKIYYVLFKITKSWSEELATPIINLSNNHILTIEAVDNANSYEVYANNQLIATIPAVAGQSEYTLDLSTLLTTASSYDIQVKAISSDPNYSNSTLSDAIAYIKPITPSVSQSGTTISWTWQNGIDKYVILKNQNIAFTITKLDNSYILKDSSNITLATLSSPSFDLADYIDTAGNHQFTMYALVDNNNQSNITSLESQSFGYYQLSTPEISFSGTVLSWNRIENATTYSIRYRSYNSSAYTDADNITLTTSGNIVSVDIKSLNLSANEYYIVVQAINTASSYNNSESSNQVTYVKLDTPNPRFSSTSNTSLLTWSDTADQYVLKIRDVESNLSTNSVDLSTKVTTADTYVVCVKATSNQSTLYYAIEDSEYSNIVQYTILSSPEISFRDSTTTLSWHNDSTNIIYNLYNGTTQIQSFTGNISYSYDIASMNLNPGVYQFSLTASLSNDNLSTHGYKSATSNEVSYEKLATPNPRFSSSSNSNLLTWEAISDKYILTINDMERELATNSIDLSTILSDPATYYISVKVTSNQSAMYYAIEDSESSNTIMYTIAGALDISYRDSKTTIFWNSESTDIVYKLYRDSTLIDTFTGKTSYSYDISTLNLTAGTYTFYVVSSLQDYSQGYQPITSNELTYVKLATPDAYYDPHFICWNTITNAQNYIISYHSSSSSATQTINVANTHTNYNLESLNLTAGTYYFSVQAINNNPGFSNSDVSIAITYIKLATPITSFSNTNNTSLLSWSPIEFADCYRIYIDNTYLSDTTENYIDLSTILTSANTYTIQIKAYYHNSIEYYREISEYSTPVQYTILNAPVINFTSAKEIFSWNKVTNATKYYVYNGTTLVSTITNSANTYSFDISSINDLSYGTHSFKVVASMNESGLSTHGFKTATSNTLTYIYEGPTITQLSTPVVTDLNYNTEILTWDTVMNASGYEVYLDGSKTATINSNSTHTYDFTSKISDNNRHYFQLKALDSNGIYTTSALSDKVYFQRSSDDTMPVANYTIRENMVAGPSVSISSSTISWVKIPYVDNYILMVYEDSPATHYITLNKNTTSYNLSNVYSTYSVTNTEILAYQLVAVMDGLYYVLSFDTSYYNPNSDIAGNYGMVYAFDGQLNDYYVTSQEELNNLMYYSFITRDTNIQFQTTSAISGSYSSKEDIAFDSFIETSYYSHSYHIGSGNIITQYINYPAGYNVDLSYYNNIPSSAFSEIYSQKSLGLEFYNLYSFEKREDSFDNFDSDNGLVRLNVTTSEELNFAVENNYVPICTPGSIAERIYNIAKGVLKEIVNDDMTDYQKALSIFDWIASNTSYDYYSVGLNTNDVMTQPCFYLEGVFICGYAVCDGFSKAYSLLCNMEGVDCIRIVGTAYTGSGYGGHAWNKVRVDGNYYMVDITWTDFRLTDSSTSVTNEILSHQYFLLSDNSISSTHIPHSNRTKFANYPTPATDYGYYEKTTYSDSSKTQDLSISSDAEFSNILNICVNQNLNYVELNFDISYYNSLGSLNAVLNKAMSFSYTNNNLRGFGLFSWRYTLNSTTVGYTIYVDIVYYT